MSTEETDNVANRTLELTGEFAALMVHKYHVPPDAMAKAAVATAVMLFLEHHANDVRAAAEYLRQYAAELEECAPANPTVN